MGNPLTGGAPAGCASYAPQFFGPTLPSTAPSAFGGGAVPPSVGVPFVSPQPQALPDPSIQQLVQAVALLAASVQQLVRMSQAGQGATPFSGAPVLPGGGPALPAAPPSTALPAPSVPVMRPEPGRQAPTEQPVSGGGAPTKHPPGGCGCGCGHRGSTAPSPSLPPQQLPSGVPGEAPPPTQGTPPIVPPAPAPAPSKGQLAVDKAKQYLGKMYQMGGNGPDVFDCSGLVKRALSEAGIDIPSRTSQDMYRGGTPVAKEQLQPGDLVFYEGDPPGHVAMYVGDGQIIHASTSGQPVKIVPLEQGGSYTGARRYA